MSAITKTKWRSGRGGRGSFGGWGRCSRSSTFSSVFGNRSFKSSYKPFSKRKTDKEGKFNKSSLFSGVIGSILGYMLGSALFYGFPSVIISIIILAAILYIINRRRQYNSRSNNTYDSDEDGLYKITANDIIFTNIADSDIDMILCSFDKEILMMDSYDILSLYHNGCRDLIKTILDSNILYDKQKYAILNDLFIVVQKALANEVLLGSNIVNVSKIVNDECIKYRNEIHEFAVKQHKILAVSKQLDRSRYWG